MADAQELAQSLRADPVHSAFLDDDFDAIGYASDICRRDQAPGNGGDGSGGTSAAEQAAADLQQNMAKIEASIEAAPHPLGSKRAASRVST